MSRGTAKVLDMSETGVRLRTLNPLEPGLQVWLKLPMLATLELRIVWVDGFDCGCAFANRLYPAVFERIANQVSPRGWC